MESDTLNQLERELRTRFHPRRVTTAEMIYERMESQSDFQLPFLYRPFDPWRRGDWHDVAICSALSHAISGADRVLDVGPGDGWPALRIASDFRSIIGIDPSMRRVREQRKNAVRMGIRNVEFHPADVLALPYPANTFHGVTAANAVEQSEDAEQAIREIARVTIPGGRLALIFERTAAALANGEGDESMRAEQTEGRIAILYRTRSRIPPREANYRLELDLARLRRETDLRVSIDHLSRAPVSATIPCKGADSVDRPVELTLTFFEKIAPVVRDSTYAEIFHLTDASVDDILSETGFTEIRHADPSIPPCSSFFDAAKASGRLPDLIARAIPISSAFGRQLVESASAGAGSLVLATRGCV